MVGDFLRAGLRAIEQSCQLSNIPAGPTAVRAAAAAC
jgi:hypothetical protein